MPVEAAEAVPAAYEDLAAALESIARLEELRPGTLQRILEQARPFTVLGIASPWLGLPAARSPGESQYWLQARVCLLVRTILEGAVTCCWATSPTASSSCCRSRGEAQMHPAQTCQLAAASARARCLRRLFQRQRSS